MKFPRKILSGLFLAAVLAAVRPVCGDVAQLQHGFDAPPDDARIMVRWWWYGIAVTKPQLEKEMNLMKEGGIGGFEVQPTYPLAVDGNPPGLVNLKFLSPGHFEALRFTADKAKELGLRMDLTLGSGWPYGGPMFSASEGAGAIHSQNVQTTADQKSVTVPQLRAGETLIGAFAGPRQNNRVDFKGLKEIPISGGAAQLPADISGPAEVVFFISSRTRMQVKRPAYGAEGNVIDHYSPDVVNKFIKEVGEPALAACGPNVPHSIFCDSLEVNGEDWTDNLLAEFQKRRGYDLRPLLPALMGDVGEKTRDIRHDWGETLTEMFNDNFNGPLRDLAKKYGTKFRIQAYGSPSAGLFSYASADLPEGEGFQWHGYRATRYASSASHLLGVPVTSSETFTWLHGAVFRGTPLDIKSEADMHFLQGVNQIICHGWPYTAEGVGFPGWSFYAAGVFNQNNPWWLVMPDITKYLQRMSFMLRQGQPANDIALYLANSDAWAGFTPGRISLSDGVGQAMGRQIVPAILDSGYNLDFFDDQMLDMRGKVDGGALAFGDVKYKVVVLSNVERIPAATMRKLEEFAKNGGTVVAIRRAPALAPGYKATEEDQKAVHDIAQRLFEGPNALGLLVDSEAKFGEMLAKRLKPDVALAPASPEVGFVHRHTDSGEIYFVANTSNQPKSVKATFRVEGLTPELWNPMTDEVHPVPIVDKPQGGTTVALDLEPYGSALLIWSNRAASAPKIASVAAPAALDMSTGWAVKFGKDGPAVKMEELKSWTADEATRHFSGVATYEKSITVSPEMLKAGLNLAISFGKGKPVQSSGGQGYQALLEGPIREAAVVYVNDKRAGSIWCPPYSLNVTGLLKAGENNIRIEVANLAVNAISAGKFPNYDYDAVVAKYGNRFQPQGLNMLQPVNSGLLGPIELVASSAAN